MKAPHALPSPPLTAGVLLTYVQDELLRSIASASTSVALASPFLSLTIAKRIVAAVERSGASKRRFLTAVSARPVRSGVLSVPGIALLMDAGFEVRSIPNLHAKLSLVDGVWGVVGSGNLTDAGLGGADASRPNVELGVRLTRNQIHTAEGTFDDWWRAAADGRVTSELLEPYAAVKVVVPASSDGLAPIGSPLPGPTTVPLPTTSGPTPRRQYWVKAMYWHGKPTGEWWRSISFIHDRHQGTPEAMTSRPRYRVGDLIALYITQPAGPGRIPAVFEVTHPAEDGRDEVAERYGAEDAKLYGWTTKVAVCRAMPVEHAPTLDVVGKSPKSLQVGRTRIHDALVFEELASRIPLVGAFSSVDAG